MSGHTRLADVSDPIRQNKTSVTNGLRASGFAVCYVCSRRGLSSLSSK